MKKLFPAGLLLASLFACNQPVTQKPDYTKDTAAVIQTDKDFNDYCTAHGRAAAFVKYADSSVLALADNQLPVRGIEELRKRYAKLHDSAISHFTWGPERGEASGNVGYTFGWWKFHAKSSVNKDTVFYGDYVTVWKRQSDSTWKYVVDAGYNTPKH